MEQGPVKFMIGNTESIMTAYREANGSPSKAWERLRTSLPGIEAVMRFNTFKQYLPLFSAMAEKTAVTQVTQEHPRNVSGWTVAKAKDGYFRLHKKIGGKGKTIYLGKTFSIEAAEEKVRAFERIRAATAGAGQV